MQKSFQTSLDESPQRRTWDERRSGEGGGHVGGTWVLLLVRFRTAQYFTIAFREKSMGSIFFTPSLSGSIKEVEGAARGAWRRGVKTARLRRRRSGGGRNTQGLNSCVAGDLHL